MNRYDYGFARGGRAGFNGPRRGSSVQPYDAEMNPHPYDRGFAGGGWGPGPAGPGAFGPRGRDAMIHGEGRGGRDPWSNGPFGGNFYPHVPGFPQNRGGYPAQGNPGHGPGWGEPNRFGGDFPSGPGFAAPPGPWNDEMELTDEEILHAVREHMYEDVWLDTEGIRISVEDGVVTLDGEVGDYLESRYAWDDAWESAGVRGVINNLRVVPDEETGTAAEDGSSEEESEEG